MYQGGLIPLRDLYRSNFMSMRVAISKAPIKNEFESQNWWNLKLSALRNIIHKLHKNK